MTINSFKRLLNLHIKYNIPEMILVYHYKKGPVEVVIDIPKDAISFYVSGWSSYTIKREKLGQFGCNERVFICATGWKDNLTRVYVRKKSNGRDKELLLSKMTSAPGLRQRVETSKILYADPKKVRIKNFEEKLMGTTRFRVYESSYVCDYRVIKNTLKKLVTCLKKVFFCGG